MILRRICYAFLSIVGALALLSALKARWQSPRTTIETPTNDIDPNAWQIGREKGEFKEPKVVTTSPYQTGQTKPYGSNYTRTLVISQLQDEDTAWVREELREWVESGLLKTAIYRPDDINSSLGIHEANKGHEALAYLSYIIDWYSNLSDITIFMHAHRYAWHNNALLDEDSSKMVQHLSPERVTREGYMNLRCHWDPGCPDWLKPAEMDYDEYKREQQILAKAWPELFPGEKTPNVLAQPCCAQFAVSRERIQAIPNERFVMLRDWLLHTELDDFLSGRLFEYTWQYLFTSSSIHCPSMSVCYCDGFGVCFGGPEAFDYYFEFEYNLNAYKKELNTTSSQHAAEANVQTAHESSAGEPDRAEWLRTEIERIEIDMADRKADALERGKQPEQRANEAGRAWVEGDGF